ncbi:hypothetical protein [Ureibacillus endophyticus]|uniref:Uncharacterized protein n=1 Tax=Ureibacillus endophyticus TaxID=1978490 RepID=A0A494YTN5_9BACL|nr:hypothetical protein [Lysinibacillus endophyticus]RKQ13460.1 hypothetical protein D8M03_16125 [Lysinibacillus endophyticus]
MEVKKEIKSEVKRESFTVNTSLKEYVAVPDFKRDVQDELFKRVLEAMPKELPRINALLPIELAKLSHFDKDATLVILHAWGDGTAPLRELWSMVQSELKKHE